MFEYLDFRCCMCPNLRTPALKICPGENALLHPEPTPCRFVKMYVDNRGWKYKVMEGLGDSNFKARYQKPDKCGSIGWKCLPALPWQKSFDAAQTDLNRYAKRRGWQEWPT